MLSWTYFPPVANPDPERREACPLVPSRSGERREGGVHYLAEWIAYGSTHSAPKGAGGAWSPATFRDNRRKNANVEAVSSLCFDFDEPLARWPHRWASLSDDRGWIAAHAPHIWHETYRSAPGAHRGRLIVPLAEPIDARTCRETLRRMTRQLGSDTSCTDPSRAFWLPQGAHAAGVALVNAGADLYRVDPVPPAPPRDRFPTYCGPSAVYDTPQQREALGVKLGAEMTADSARRVRCPHCGRRSVWWWVAPERATRARCSHVNGCGWSGRLGELA